MAVSIVVATPALATSPKMQDLRTAEAAKYHAKIQMAAIGWHSSQWPCLARMWGKESAWNPNAQNKTPVRVLKGGKRVNVHAGGIPQILGLNPRLSVPEQVSRGLTYIESRYGSPCQAWKFWQKHYWY